MEIWDLYNLERKVIGEHIRGNELPELLFTKVRKTILVYSIKDLDYFFDEMEDN